MTNQEKEDLLKEFIKYLNQFGHITNGDLIIKNFINQPKIYRGIEVLKLPKGTFVQVVWHKDGDAEDDILIRLLGDQQPFVNIKTGTVWGNSLENYIFKEVKKEDVLDIKI